MSKPVQLQINQSGAWRGALDFDATDVPDEFLQAAESLVRLSGSDATMRVVMREQRDGRSVATREVLTRWTRKDGWVNA